MKKFKDTMIKLSEKSIDEIKELSRDYGKLPALDVIIIKQLNQAITGDSKATALIRDTIDGDIKENSNPFRK